MTIKDTMQAISRQYRGGYFNMKTDLNKFKDGVSDLVLSLFAVYMFLSGAICGFIIGLSL